MTNVISEQVLWASSEIGNTVCGPTITGQTIVCFARDWSESPTSNNHVMTELARNNRVLWLNSVSTRVPNLGSGRDLRKIIAKLAGFFRGPKQMRENLWVYTPLVLPFPHSRFARALNRRILQLALKRLRRRLGFDDFQLWTFLPNVGDYVGVLGETLSVYYCTDEWSQFNYVDGRRIAQAERRLCEKVDVVFATAQSLVDARRQWNPRTYLARHGVDHRLFSSALVPAAAPPDIAAIPRPIVGFYGTIQDWVDFDLIVFLARRHPEWSIVLIGKPMVDLSRFSELRNVHILGVRPYEQLPEYCRSFSVGIIPYILNDRIMHVNPLKLREYLCAGLPVVSVALPEVEMYSGFCSVAHDHEQFETAIAAAIRTDSQELRERRAAAMQSESWSHRVSDLGGHIARIGRDKCHAIPNR